MAVLWNNFIIPKSFHIRHVSAVFQEFYAAKDEFFPKIVNTLQIQATSADPSQISCRGNAKISHRTVPTRPVTAGCFSNSSVR